MVAQSAISGGDVRADADAAIVLRAATDGARFGAALSSVGGEGSWLAGGAPGWSDASGEGGAVLLFEGDGLTSDTAFDHVRRLQGALGDDEIGTRLVPAPDSFGGLLIGAPGARVEAATEAGIVWWWR